MRLKLVPISNTIYQSRQGMSSLSQDLTTGITSPAFGIGDIKAMWFCPNNGSHVFRYNKGQCLVDLKKTHYDSPQIYPVEGLDSQYALEKWITSNLKDTSKQRLQAIKDSLQDILTF